jgi:hypothetical protein
MEIYTIQRPSLLPAAVLAPSAFRPSTATSPVVAAAKPAPAPQVHQVQIQAELARELVLSYGGNGTTGFVGSNGVSVDSKPMTDAASGVPPRGRPV